MIIKQKISFMKKIFLALSGLLILSAIFSSCTKVIGTGPQVSEIRDVDGFSGISLDMDATINITQDSFFHVEVLAQSNILDKIVTSVSGSHLKITHKNNVIIKSSSVTVNISMPAVSYINVSGSGSVRLQSQLLADNLEMNVSGSGSIHMPTLTAANINSNISGSGKIQVAGGTAASLDSRISGSGDLEMLNVQTGHVNTITSGSGTTKVYAVNSLFAKISGSGDVYYRGNPSVESQISGSGQLIHQ
jgi:hypothetical protein